MSGEEVRKLVSCIGYAKRLSAKIARDHQTDLVKVREQLNSALWLLTRHAVIIPGPSPSEVAAPIDLAQDPGCTDSSSQAWPHTYPSSDAKDTFFSMIADRCSSLISSSIAKMGGDVSRLLAQTQALEQRNMEIEQMLVEHGTLSIQREADRQARIEQLETAVGNLRAGAERSQSTRSRSPTSARIESTCPRCQEKHASKGMMSHVNFCRPCRREIRQSQIDQNVYRPS